MAGRSCGPVLLDHQLSQPALRGVKHCIGNVPNPSASLLETLRTKRGAICGASRSSSSAASVAPKTEARNDSPITTSISGYEKSAESSRPSSLLEAAPSTPSASTTTVSALPSQRAPSSRDPWRLVGVSFALAATGEAIYSWLAAQPALPPVEVVASDVATVALLVLLGAPSALLAAKVLLGDKFHVEFHRGRLYVSAGVPSQGPPMTPGSVEVRPTGDVRGNGAYATRVIPAGTHIGDYSGDRLDRAAFAARYPDGVGNYAMAVDDEWVIDAAHLAPYTATFHPVHMNHSRTRANVRRYYRRAEGRVAFFADTDIQPGQELLYDYGRSYWYGREHLELP